MGYRGRVKNGVIVLDEPMKPPEGAVGFVRRVRGMLHRRTADQSVPTEGPGSSPVAEAN